MSGSLFIEQTNNYPQHNKKMGQVGKTKATKATKKFIKKNLKKEIVRRKEVKKITDSNRRKEKSKKDQNKREFIPYHH